MQKGFAELIQLPLLAAQHLVDARKLRMIAVAVFFDRSQCGEGQERREQHERE
jgi:hypothetical protein